MSRSRPFRNSDVRLSVAFDLNAAEEAQDECR
jgi:hypothetical protein